jgi:DNA-binding transcriptional ArsR family regulator
MKALSNEDRVEVFAVLCERVASPKEISAELNAGLSQVSYHVKVLRECKLIALDHKVPRRGAVEHFYRAVEPTPGELCWTPLLLDSTGIEELGQLTRDFLKSALEVQANATERQAGKKDAAESIPATVFLASFLSSRRSRGGKKASATKRR